MRAIVRYAAQHVPYYRELALDPDDFASADDLAALPLLHKETVQRDPERFRPSPEARGRAFPFPTSGSSGTPLVIYHEGAALLRYLSTGVRHDEVACRLVGRGRRTTVRIAHGNSTGVRTRRHFRGATLFPARGRRVQVSPEEPIRAGLDAVNAHRPLVVSGWGGAIESLFRLVAAESLPMHLPKLVWIHSEGMTDDGRRLVEERFGIPVISTYASVETFRIAFFCERRTGHHVHEDCCHVRVVRDDGVDAAAGEAGEVVVSNLVNRGMVLLNYRLGDVAALLDEDCGCGRSFRLLGPVEGRISEVVELPDGTRVHPFSVAGAVREEGLLRFQLIQEAPTRFRLEVVTIDDAAYARVIAHALPTLRVTLKGAEVAVVRRSELASSPDRKFRRVVALGAP